MITPKEFEFAVRGLVKAIGQLLDYRGSGQVRVQDSRTAIVRHNGTDHVIQLDDAVALVLRQTIGDTAALEASLARCKVESWHAATHTQHQAKRICPLISRRRIQTATPAERRMLIEILVYARATRAFGNRFNGLAAAIQTLRSLDRLSDIAGTFAAEIEQWEKCLHSMRRRARLERQLKRLERMLEAAE